VYVWISAKPLTNVLHNILVDKIMKNEQDKSIVRGIAADILQGPRVFIRIQ